MPSCFAINKNITFAQDVRLEESPATMDEPKRVLIVMDALKEFSVDLLEWVLKNFTFGHCCSITLLGIMPWLNIPLSSKTWSKIWSMDLEDLSTFQQTTEFKNDLKKQKVQHLIGLCRNYGVALEIRTGMGHPLRLLVAEQISSLHATLVVFDRHHERKYIDYYSQKIPCNMVVMNDNGEVELIKKRKLYDSEVDYTPIVGSAASTESKTKSVYSDKIKKCLKSKPQGKTVEDLN